MARSFRRNHKNVDPRRWNNSLEMNVKTVAESQIVPVLESRFDLSFVGLALKLVRQQGHDDIGRLDGLGRIGDSEAGIFGFCPGLTFRFQTNYDVNSRVAQVVCVRMTLATVAKNRNPFSFENTQICVAIIINLHGSLLKPALCIPGNMPPELG